jgi:hypothetical protein
MSRFIDRHWDGLFFASIVLAFILFFSSIFLVIRQIDRHMTVQSCKHWATTHGRPTKFAQYNWWDWECLTPNPSIPGEWIGTGQLRGVNDK